MIDDELNRTIISRESAKARYQDKLEETGLDKNGQRDFYRRYDNFEKRIFRSSNSFYKNKYKNKAPNSLNNTLYPMARTGPLSTTYSTPKTSKSRNFFTRETFKTVTSKFILQRNKLQKEPVFEPSLANRS